MKQATTKIMSCVLAVMMVIGTFVVGASAATCAHNNRKVLEVATATCSKYGYTAYKCLDCGDEFITDFIAPTQHDYSIIVMPAKTPDEKLDATHVSGKATCQHGPSKDGGFICAICGEPKEGTFDESGTVDHAWVAESLVKPAYADDEYKQGTVVFTCKYCGIKGSAPISCDHEADSHYKNKDWTDVIDKDTVWSYKETKDATYSCIVYRTFTCKKCGFTCEEATNVKIENHNFDDGESKVEKPATCTEKGYYAAVCLDCGYADAKVYPALGHVPGEYVSAPYHDIATDTDHAEPGAYGTQYLCKSCGEIFDNAADRPAHEYKINSDLWAKGKGNIAVDAETGKTSSYDAMVSDCTSKTAKAPYICTICGAQTVKTTTKTTGHVYERDIKWEGDIADCQTKGTKTAKCLYCTVADKSPKKVIDNKTDPNNHPADAITWDTTKSIDATCTKDGKMIGYCTACGKDTGIEEIIPATGHTFSDFEGVWAVTGTDLKDVRAKDCKENGWYTYKCTSCDEYVKVDVAAQPHSFEKFQKAQKATCDKNGYSEDCYLCSVCGAPSNGKLTKAGHTMVTIAKDTYKANGTDGSYTVAATCTSAGFTIFDVAKDAKYCKNCDKSDINYKKLEKTAHNNITVKTDDDVDDCTVTQFTVNLCNDCGFAKVVELTVGNASHTLEVNNGYVPEEKDEWGKARTVKDGVVAPTCELEGYTAYSCKNCGYVEKKNIVKAKGHVNSEGQTLTRTCPGNAADITNFVCVNCKNEVETLSKDDPAYHTGEKKIDHQIPATCTTPEWTLYYWDCCGERYIEVGGAVDHSYASPTDLTDGSGLSIERCTATDCPAYKVNAEVEYIYELIADEENNTITLNISVKNDKAEAIEINTAKLVFQNSADTYEFVEAENYNSAFNKVTVKNDKSAAIDVSGIKFVLNPDGTITLVDDSTNGTNNISVTAKFDAPYELAAGEKLPVATLTFKLLTDDEDADYSFVIEDASKCKVDDYKTKAKDYVTDDSKLMTSELPVVAPVTPVDPEIKAGDVDGDGVINGKDLITLRKFLAGDPAYNVTGNADANGDGVINGKDLVVLRKYLASLDASILGPQIAK